MIVVRDVLQARFGRAGELVRLLKELHSLIATRIGDRVMTDLAGQFDTVVVESEVVSLEGWYRELQQSLAMPGFREWFARMQPLIESGHREFFRIE